MNNQIVLRGCAPEPLIHYLKALGIFRLVVEQEFDKNARAFWRGDVFILESARTTGELIDFFLNQYSPTPIVAPWNGGSGFYPQDKNQRAMVGSLCRIDSQRVADYRDSVATARALVGDRKEQPKEEEKAAMLRQARCIFSDRALKWLDAAYVLGEAKPDYPPILGSGGNDGRLDFTINFVARLLTVLPEAIRQQPNERKIAQQLKRSETQLREALFLDNSATLEKAAVGQFYPAGAGGANASQGVSGDSLVNPWDFILAIEGTLVLASATVRQLAAGARSKASFPFTAQNSTVGYGTATSNEKMRAEIWLPLWSRPASFAEASYIFSEGRVQFGKMQKRLVRTGFDFARAVAELGVDRGIDAFQRYGFIERNGQANLAASLGRFEVRERPHAALIYEVDRWLDSLRRTTRDAKRAPERLTRAVSQIEEAIFDLCASGEAEHLRTTLIALGAAEAEVARTANLKKDDKGNVAVRPLTGLTVRWVSKCDDNSFEFEIAAALASITGEGKRGLFRANIEPVEISEKGIGWTNDDAGVVWGTGSLEDNLAAVLHRRSIDARAASASHPALSSKRFASLRAVNAFLSAAADNEEIESLLRGLMLIKWSGAPERKLYTSDNLPPTLSRAYAMLKLLFLPEGRLERLSEPIKHEPSIVPLLRAGRINDALEVADKRLRSSGLVPFTNSFHVSSEEGARLAAALLIPIDRRAINELDMLVLRRPGKQQQNDL
jgi:CRISPR-associated protein Csx17